MCSPSIEVDSSWIQIKNQEENMKAVHCEETPTYFIIMI